jgi:hypothetical protein
MHARETALASAEIDGGSHPASGSLGLHRQGREMRSCLSPFNRGVGETKFRVTTDQRLQDYLGLHSCQRRAEAMMDSAVERR